MLPGCLTGHCTLVYLSPLTWDRRRRIKQIFRGEEKTPRNLLMNFDLITITSGRSFGRHQIRLEDVPTQTPSWVGGLSLSFLWIWKRKGGRLFLYYKHCKDGVFRVRGVWTILYGPLFKPRPQGTTDGSSRYRDVSMAEVSLYPQFRLLCRLGNMDKRRVLYKQTRLPLGYE